MNDDRPVHIRTSASVKEIWFGDANRCTESGRILGRDAPFGRQMPPWSVLPPSSPRPRTPLEPIQSSREIEKKILVNELEKEDNGRDEITCWANRRGYADVQKENEQLKQQNRKLMKIIHLLTEQMVENARRG